MTAEADRIEHAARVAWQTSADFGEHVGEMWRHQTPAVQERWRAIAQAVLDYAEPSEEVKRLESQVRALRSAYEHAAAQRDKYMRRTAEWRSAALDGHEMPEDDDDVRACTGCGKCSYCTALPQGLCGNRTNHAPHVQGTSSLGRFYCHADQTKRLPFAMGPQS